ncbi:hypothetical protein HOG17_01125 [Candidatus Peregrinibacteria bacterium]|jgi:hypothetical protein|nr:hypothetical protein [Candidatus Peregrinibacteria bacterium]MBT4148712.1 hypothetical protein [Candidatus Peregrinibacteria bacterium]MBT4456289.1 hypothetical protein [Candidatus Peregrinibacteria bacterium]
MKKLLITIIAISSVLTACTSTNTITKDEMNQGWYYGQQDEQKEGTPEDWTFLEDGENSKWIKPLVENMMDY